MASRDKMTWDGRERRSVNPEYEYIKGQIALLHEKIDNIVGHSCSVQKECAKLIQKHNETLYGNGKEGITTKVTGLSHEMSGHIMWDRWLYGIMFSAIIFIAGVLISQ
jgi:hypothetical protein